jgi:hypothetical protein
MLPCCFESLGVVSSNDAETAAARFDEMQKISNRRPTYAVSYLEIVFNLLQQLHYLVRYKKPFIDISITPRRTGALQQPGSLRLLFQSSHPPLREQRHRHPRQASGRH